MEHDFTITIMHAQGKKEALSFADLRSQTLYRKMAWFHIQTLHGTSCSCMTLHATSSCHHLPGNRILTICMACRKVTCWRLPSAWMLRSLSWHGMFLTWDVLMSFRMSPLQVMALLHIVFIEATWECAPQVLALPSLSALPCLKLRLNVRLSLSRCPSPSTASESIGQFFIFFSTACPHASSCVWKSGILLSHRAFNFFSRSHVCMYPRVLLFGP